MNKATLEFLFIGPLFSLFKTLEEMRSDIVGLQDSINALVEQLSKAKGEILSKISELEAQVAAGEAVDLEPLKAAVQALDDVVPDEVTEEEPPAEEATEEPVQ